MGETVRCGSAGGPNFATMNSSDPSHFGGHRLEPVERVGRGRPTGSSGWRPVRSLRVPRPGRWACAMHLRAWAGGPFPARDWRTHPPRSPRSFTRGMPVVAQVEARQPDGRGGPPAHDAPLALGAVFHYVAGRHQVQIGRHAEKQVVIGPLQPVGWDTSCRARRRNTRGRPHPG